MSSSGTWSLKNPNLEGINNNIVLGAYDFVGMLGIFLSRETDYVHPKRGDATCFLGQIVFVLLSHSVVDTEPLELARFELGCTHRC
jgi:hypothetical protein